MNLFSKPHDISKGVTMALSKILFTFVAVSWLTCSAQQVSPAESLVFGSGIDPRRNTQPYYYVYVQLRTADGLNYTDDISKSDVTLKLTGNHRVFQHKLGNGLFVWRYRIIKEVKTMEVTVKYRGQHIASSPYVTGLTLTEKCHCPFMTIDQVLENWNCPLTDSRIESDLEPYRENGINLRNLDERIEKEFPRSHGVHYSIINNKIYAKTFGTIVDFRYMSDYILTSLTDKAVLPNMELMVQVGDWPQDKAKNGTVPFPFFSWCGAEDYRDIVWPQYDILRSTIQAMDRVSLDITMVQESQNIPWEERIPKGYFRGRDSNRARLELVKKYWNNTELFDVGLVAYFFHDHDEELYGPKATRVGLPEFFKYRYQINIDGTVAAYRLPFLFGGGSLVLKQDSKYYEHFYNQLEPWVHYVPVQIDLSDLEEKILWAIEHDDEAQQIAKNAFQLVQDHLMPDRLYCYMYRLLKEYAALQKGVPKIHPGMEAINAQYATKDRYCSLCPVNPTSTKDEL